MKVKFVNIGKTNIAWSAGINEYKKRICKFIDFEIVDLVISKNKSKSIGPDMVKRNETKAILKYIDKADYIILLDEKGKEFTSEGFARFLNKTFISRKKNIVFISGGAYGFDKEVYQISNEKISLSKLTFTHQMVRLLFVEQLYRALTIINGHPYHNE